MKVKDNREIAEAKINLGDWGNSKAFRVPSTIVKQMELTDEKKFRVIIEITPEGKKRMVIEEEDNTPDKPEYTREEKLQFLNDLTGVIENEGKDYKEMRNEAIMSRYGL